MSATPGWGVRSDLLAPAKGADDVRISVASDASFSTTARGGDDSLGTRLGDVRRPGPGWRWPTHGERRCRAARTPAAGSRSFAWSRPWSRALLRYRNAAPRARRTAGSGLRPPPPPRGRPSRDADRGPGTAGNSQRQSDRGLATRAPSGRAYGISTRTRAVGSGPSHVTPITIAARSTTANNENAIATIASGCMRRQSSMVATATIRMRLTGRHTTSYWTTVSIAASTTSVATSAQSHHSCFGPSETGARPIASAPWLASRCKRKGAEPPA